ncbi:MAG: arylamine N-acetyltransferase [Oscillospiraceae bacterium]|nr:arylamine N-acetyltransferase [Oscillospiraceae bacterium]
MSGERNNPFEKVYGPIKDVNAYLNRIGFDGKAIPSLDCLKKLMHCHLMKVPFENLDVFHGHKEPSLEVEAMFEKIVIKRRGGYCFELNGLFSKLLEAVGFSVSSSIARIRFGRDFIPPAAHRVITVKIADKSYFCDVGFGGPVPLEPIEIAYDKVIELKGDRRYKFSREERGTTLLIEKDENFVPVLMFDDFTCDEADFIPLNAFCAYSVYEPFRKKQMLWKLTENGRCSIDGDVLRLSENGKTSEMRLATEAELRNAFEKYFGIVYEEELREWKCFQK